MFRTLPPLVFALFLGAGVLGASSAGWGADGSPVDVVGLFKDRAVLRLPNGNEAMLRVGEEKGGVALLAADANQARVRYQGKTYRLNLSSRIRGGYKKVDQARVTVNADPLGQFYVRGAVNQRFVNFLVDTGASVVAISSQVADGLGIDYRTGQKGTVQTAQGVVDSYFVRLDQVTVGAINVSNVDAAIIEGAYPTDILLGMSFLRNVQMQENDGVLMLTRKF
ncbi:MAG: retropepsin-like aspartic protease [Pseudomonadota bacterium]